MSEEIWGPLVQLGDDRLPRMHKLEAELLLQQGAERFLGHCTVGHFVLFRSAQPVDDARSDRRAVA